MCSTVLRRRRRSGPEPTLSIPYPSQQRSCRTKRRHSKLSWSFAMASYLLTSPSSTLSIPKLATFSSNHRPLFLRTPHRSPSLYRESPKWCLSAADADAPSYEPVEAEEEETGDGLVEAGDVPDSVEVQIAEYEASSESSKREKGEDVYAVVMVNLIFPFYSSLYSY